MIGAQPALAQSDQSPLVGSRPLALGGAFTAVADDANAMFYNPAGLQSLRQHEITFMNADLFGTGIRTVYAAYALPIGLKQAAGIDWQHIGFGDAEVAYNRDIIKLAFARQLHRSFSVGGGLKYLTTNISLDGHSVGRGSGMGVDLGALFSPIPQITLGINLHDATGTKVRYDAGGTETLLPRMIRGGVAWRATSNLLLAADVDRKFHLGGEYWLKNMLACRFGIRKDLKTSDPLVLNFGVGLRYRTFQFDFSHAPAQRGLGHTYRYGFSAALNLSPSPVRIVRVEMDDMFASFYQTYQKTPIGSILLQSRSDKPVVCRLTLSIPEYETSPHLQTIIVRQGKEPQPFPLFAFLSRNALSVSKDRTVPVKVQVEYETADRTQSSKHTARATLYRRGLLPRDDAARAAAFVTSRDPEVAKFASAVSHRVSAVTLLQARRLKDHMLQAAALFEALRRFGIRCPEDAVSTQPEATGADRPLEVIQYPGELLHTRTGGNADCVVLYCALLENLGIPAGVADVSGRMLTVFDAGVDASTVSRLGLPADLFLEQEGRLWVPVETAPGSLSFGGAWASGIELMSKNKQAAERIQPLSEAWQRFPPTDPAFDFVPADSLIVQACDRDIVWRAMRSLDRLKEEIARGFARRVRVREDTVVVLPGGPEMEMVWIAPGSFTMGSPGTEGGRSQNEAPRRVALRQGFFLGKYEVSQHQWEAVMATRPWTEHGISRDHLDHPVTNISWEDAQTFIGKLNTTEGDTLYGLPTEAQWEYACRAGTTTPWSFGNEGDQLENYGWYRGNTVETGEIYAHPVGQKAPNPWGLYDMHGNVQEWTRNWYGSYKPDPEEDPTGPNAGSSRVVRGGSFLQPPDKSRSAFRSTGLPFRGYRHVGLRVLRQCPQEATLTVSTQKNRKDAETPPEIDVLLPEF